MSNYVSCLFSNKFKVKDTREVKDTLERLGFDVCEDNTGYISFKSRSLTWDYETSDTLDSYLQNELLDDSEHILINEIGYEEGVNALCYQVFICKKFIKHNNSDMFVEQCEKENGND